MHFLNLEYDDGMAYVELNRPERRNAVGTPLLDALMETFRELENAPDVRVIVLGGAGPGFCAGADLKEFSGDDQEAVLRLNARLASFLRSFALIDTPVVAAVDGFALGGGLMLAAGCDVVVTGREARWHLPEVSLGWLPGFGLHLLALRVGVYNARRLTWGAEPIDGIEANRLGLADIVAPERTSARIAALAHARRLAALPPHSVVSAKRFFALQAASSGEPSDTSANRIYAGDVQHPTARANMLRFKPGA